MSAAYNLRTQIKAAIVTANIGLVADDIVIDRQQDILAAVAQTVAIASNGVALTILPAAGDTVDPDSESLLMDMTLSLSLWVNPVYDLDATPEETIAEALMTTLHHAELAVHTIANREVWQRLKVLGFADVNDPEYLRREIRLQTEVLG